MKRLFIYSLLCTISFGSTYGQNKTQSVFVMVDLSLNIKTDQSPITPPMRQDAIDFARAIITASYKPGDFPNWQKAGVSINPEIDAIIQGKGSPLIDEDDFLMVIPFGNIDTPNRFQINLIKNYPSDFNRYYQFPFAYDEQNTWGNYAEAKVCNLAFNHQIPEYYIVRIQGRPDDPNSHLLTKEDQEMVDGYETGAVGEVIARFKHTVASRYLVTIKKIDISKFPEIKNYKAVTIKSTNTDPTRKSLRIVSPKGKRKLPYVTASSSIQLSWSCIGCDSISKYTIRVNNLDTKKSKTLRVTRKTFTSLKLEPATYKISVSTQGANSKPQYIRIEDEELSSGLGPLFVIIVLLVGGYGGGLVDEFPHTIIITDCNCVNHIVDHLFGTGQTDHQQDKTAQGSVLATSVFMGIVCAFSTIQCLLVLPDKAEWNPQVSMDSIVFLHQHQCTTHYLPTDHHTFYQR